ncbi:MAG: archease [Candidatus Aminicenantes bacterium]|nr:archease [Candidatus Aminicenantes bacterium]
MKRYETFATTADVGVRIFGRTFAELYENAVAGLNALLFARKKGKPIEIGACGFSFRGDGVENVLVNLLAEVLSLVYQKNRRVTAVACRQADEHFIDADLLLAKIDEEPELDIKAVTYHKLQVVETDGVKSAAVFFDV